MNTKKKNLSYFDFLTAQTKPNLFLSAIVSLWKAPCHFTWMASKREKICRLLQHIHQKSWMSLTPRPSRPYGLFPAQEDPRQNQRPATLSRDLGTERKKLDIGQSWESSLLVTVSHSFSFLTTWITEKNSFLFFLEEKEKNMLEYKQIVETALANINKQTRKIYSFLFMCRILSTSNPSTPYSYQ